VGSGLVWDSDAAGEYEECRLKARVLTAPRPSFQLLEALLWEPDRGYFLLAAHLARLADTRCLLQRSTRSNRYCSRSGRSGADADEASKIRLRVDLDGHFTLEAEPLAQGALAATGAGRVGARAGGFRRIWLYHKTTRREVYATARASRPDCDEVILWNERGELTEADTANLVLDLDGDWVTPPVNSGLLAGTFRGELLAEGRIRERVLSVADLGRAQGVYLINAVRQWQSVRLIP
jgi:para-aminobenzoate synthetase/4-amino-4-deoxychorismate lyase